MVTGEHVTKNKTVVMKFCFTNGRTVNHSIASMKHIITDNIKAEINKP